MFGILSKEQNDVQPANRSYKNGNKHLIELRQVVKRYDTVILVISTLASILPARNATRISVRESLAYL